MNLEHERRLEIAADWLLQLREPAIAPDQIAEWIAWCDADPRNRQAFVRQQALWHQTASLRERPVQDESLTVRATRSALAKIDADPQRLN